MSRTGKKPISLPEKVDVKLEGLSITVKGPKVNCIELFLME